MDRERGSWVAEELADGLFRGIFALVRSLVGFLLEVLRDVLVEIVMRGLIHLVAAFFHAIGFLIERALWLVEALYFTLLRRPVGKRTALVHAQAVAMLMLGGFFVGATASVLYHADWTGTETVASSTLER
jgi:hypothetical protein